jgi:hypothetical protein
MEAKTLKEIELSISFGQRLMAYYKKCLDRMLATMFDNDRIRQHYQSDKAYINEVISSLERGEGISYLYAIKRRLTIVGQEFFKKEFKELKNLHEV